MKIGLIDCDRKNAKSIFPNLALMKLSSWHKAQGDIADWYDWTHADVVYISKVFSWSADYDGFLDADRVEKGGSGYAITLRNGREVYDKTKDAPLPYDIEHSFPDYDLYGIKDTAYGFLTRGCPRDCAFCHTAAMQGRVSRRVASLDEWWKGQRNIVLLDPNIIACRDWADALAELAESEAVVDFTQGIDARLLTEAKAQSLMRVKTKMLHFAWDRYEDRDKVLPKLQMFKQMSEWDRRKLIVYVLVGDRERQILDTDLERIYTLREGGFYPYVMIYNKDSLPKGHDLRKLQRWVNNRFIWESTKTFKEYLNK